MLLTTPIFRTLNWNQTGTYPYQFLLSRAHPVRRCGNQPYQEIHLGHVQVANYQEKNFFLLEKKKLIDLTQIQKLIPPPKIIPKTVNFPLETCWNIPFCHTYESRSFLSQFVIFPPQHLKKPFTLLSLKSSQPQFCPGNINTSSREKFNYEY